MLRLPGPVEPCQRLRHKDAVNCIYTSRHYCVTGSKDGSISLWDLRCRNEGSNIEGDEEKKDGIEGSAMVGKVCQLDVPLHICSINAVVISNNEKIIVASCAEYISIWKLNDSSSEGNIKYDYCTLLSAHIGFVTALAISPDSLELYSTGKDNVVRLWDLDSYACTQELKGHSHYIYCMCLSPDGTTLYTGGHDRTIIVWSLLTFQKVIALASGYGSDEGSVLAISISPDGQTLFTSSKNIIKIWNLATNRIIGLFDGHTGTVKSLNCSPLNTPGRLYSTSTDRSVKIWDISNISNITTGDNSKLCLHTLTKHIMPVTASQVTLDHRFLITGSIDKNVFIYSIAELKKIEFHLSDRSRVAKINAKLKEKLRREREERFKNIHREKLDVQEEYHARLRSIVESDKNTMEQYKLLKQFTTEFPDYNYTLPLYPDNSTALMHCSKNGLTVLMKELLTFADVRKNINQCDAQGDTAAHYACRGNQFDSLVFLVDNGAKYHVLNSEGLLPDLVTTNETIRKQIFEYLDEKYVPYQEALDALRTAQASKRRSKVTSPGLNASLHLYASSPAPVVVTTSTPHKTHDKVDHLSDSMSSLMTPLAMSASPEVKLPPSPPPRPPSTDKKSIKIVVPPSPSRHTEAVKETIDPLVNEVSLWLTDLHLREYISYIIHDLNIKKLKDIKKNTTTLEATTTVFPKLTEKHLNHLFTQGKFLSDRKIAIYKDKYTKYIKNIS